MTSGRKISQRKKGYLLELCNPAGMLSVALASATEVGSVYTYQKSVGAVAQRCHKISQIHAHTFQGQMQSSPERLSYFRDKGLLFGR